MEGGGGRVKGRRYDGLKQNSTRGGSNGRIG